MKHDYYNYYITNAGVSASIIKEQAAWLKSTFGQRGECWTHKNGVFWFMNESDRNWFILRWP